MWGESACRKIDWLLF